MMSDRTTDQPLAGCRVLVVEDQFFIAEQIVEALEDMGADVVGPAGRATEVERLLQKTPVEGAVLDYRLDGDTTKIAERLVNDGALVLFLSGSDRPTELPSCLLAVPWIDKGVPLAKLKQIMQVVFGNTNLSSG